MSKSRKSDTGTQSELLLFHQVIHYSTASIAIERSILFYSLREHKGKKIAQFITRDTWR